MLLKGRLIADRKSWPDKSGKNSAAPLSNAGPFGDPGGNGLFSQTMEVERSGEGNERVNPKLGYGGLTDIEFIAQYLQRFPRPSGARGSPEQYPQGLKGPAGCGDPAGGGLPDPAGRPSVPEFPGSWAATPPRPAGRAAHLPPRRDQTSGKTELMGLARRHPRRSSPGPFRALSEGYTHSSRPFPENFRSKPQKE